MTSPSSPATPSPLSEVPVARADKASISKGPIYQEFSDIHAKLQAAERREITLTPLELAKMTHRMGEITHQLQSTSATGPKREPKPKEAKKPKGTPPTLMDLPDDL